MKKSYSRILAALVSLLLILTVGAGATLAYLHTTAGPVTNTFEPGKVPPTIVEEFDQNVKKSVEIKNLGNVDAFVRVALVVTWQDAAGNVANVAPVKGTDYDFALNTEAWDAGSDGFYYHKTSVAPNGLTANMFTGEGASVKTPNNAPEGYTLHIEVVASTIQADYNGTGAHPAATHWGVAVNGDTISAS